MLSRFLICCFCMFFLNGCVYNEEPMPRVVEDYVEPYVAPVVTPTAPKPARQTLYFWHDGE